MREQIVLDTVNKIYIRNKTRLLYDMVYNLTYFLNSLVVQCALCDVCHAHLCPCRMRLSRKEDEYHP